MRFKLFWHTVYSRDWEYASIEMARTVKWVVTILAALLWQPGPTSVVASSTLSPLEFEARIYATETSKELLRLLRWSPEADPLSPWRYRVVIQKLQDGGALEDAERILEEGGAPAPVRLYGRALLKFYEDQEDSAAKLADAARLEYSALGHLEGQGFALLLEGRAHRFAGRFDKARGVVNKAMSMFETAGNEVMVQRTRIEAGAIERRTNHLKQSETVLRDVINALGRGTDRRGLARASQGLAYTLRAMQRYREAIDEFSKSLKIHQELNSRWAVYSVHRELSKTHARLNRLEDVLIHGDLATKQALALGGFDRAASQKLRLGRALVGGDRLQDAIVYLQGAYELDQQGKAMRVAWIDVDLSRAQTLAGEFVAAVTTAKRGTATAQAANATKEEAGALTNLAWALTRLGRSSEALIAQRRSLELLETLGDTPDIVEAHNTLAAIHRNLGSIDSAIHYLQRGSARIDDYLAQRKSARASRMRARLLGNLGVMHGLQEEWDPSIVALREALSIRRELEDLRGQVVVGVNLASVLRRSGAVDEARTLIDEALSTSRRLGDSVSEVWALAQDAELSCTARPDPSIHERFRSLQHKAEALGLRQERALAHAGLARCLERHQLPAAALAEYRLALDLLDRLRSEAWSDTFRTRFFASQAEIYDRAIVLQASLESSKQPHAPLAFELAERYRARGLVELLSDEPLEQLAEQERKLLDAVSVAVARVTQAVDETTRSAAQEQLKDAELALREREIDPTSPTVRPPLSLAETQRQLVRKGETWLRYVFAGDVGMLWIIDQQQVRRLSISREKVERARAAYLAQAGDAGGGLVGHLRMRHEEELGQLLIPVAIPEGHRLVVFPDGPLHGLPFSAIRYRGDYLIESHELQIAPSVTTLRGLRERRPPTAGTSFLGVGAAVGSAIPYSSSALQRIATGYPEARRTLLRGPDATRAALREQPLDSFRLIHFSTHGWTDPDLPLHVGIQLSPDDGGADASILLPDDVLAMHLAAELVVLATCSSGQGETLAGEGVVGMARAFLRAGSRSVIVSLWDVSDRATAEFMEQFYKRLPELGVPEALRQAKLSFIHSDRPALREPYRWAPFVLIGDTIPMER